MTREELQEIETRRDSLRVEVQRLNNKLETARPYFRKIDQLEQLIEHLDYAEQVCIIRNRIEYQIPIRSEKCREALINAINTAIADLKITAEELE